MKKSVLLAFLFALVSLPAAAQVSTTMPITGDAFAYEAITVADTAIGFTVGTYAPTAGLPAKMVMITVESQPLRYRLDGTAPTASEGHALAANDVRYVVGANNIRKFRMIRSTGSSATVRVTYFY
jgi:hypothetical protein